MTKLLIPRTSAASLSVFLNLEEVNDVRAFVAAACYSIVPLVPQLLILTEGYEVVFLREIIGRKRFCEVTFPRKYY